MRLVQVFATVAAAGVAFAAGAAAAQTASDFVIFKNNEATGSWTKTSETNSTGVFVPATGTPSPNPAGGMKSSFYQPTAHTASNYSGTWQQTDGTTCTFSSNAFINAFNNMAFMQSVMNSSPSTHTCTGSVPSTSNTDGSYDYNYEAG